MNLGAIEKALVIPRMKKEQGAWAGYLKADT
jgi:hypothetical protein